jgi:YidC/Oxa1 family membrane protein insertase
MFTTIIVQPIFNLLVLVYTLLPGHNFGLSIIIFTVLIRLAMWPLVKRQLRQAKIMRTLQPEMKRIKKETKGDRQKESAMLMELYKERGVNPVGSIGILIPQFIILIGLYSGLQRVITKPHSLVTFAYPVLQHTHWMQQVAHNIHLFDNTLFGIVDLTRSASGKMGVYWPAMIIVILSAVSQFYQAKQLMPNDKNARGLRSILKDAGGGQQADQSEVNAAVGRSTRYLLPVMIFLLTVSRPAALSLYWLTGGVVAFIQQGIALREDEADMEALADAPIKNVKDIPEAEVVTTPPKKTAKAPPKHKKQPRSKRRKK